MGALRLLLALAVVASHVLGSPSFPINGRGAVLLFFLISGFYMALILNEKYVGPGSTWRFYKSRYLRLWIPYVIVSILIWVGGHSYSQHISEFPWHVRLFSYFSNIFIFGQDLFYLFSYPVDHLVYLPYGQPGWNGDRGILNPVIFTVSLELYFYILAPFILRSFSRIAIFTLIGFAWHFFLYATDNNGIDVQYHLFPATFLFFGLGAAAYWINFKADAIPQAEKLIVFAVLIATPWLNLVIQAIVVTMFFFAIGPIFNLSKHSSFDRALGELSYPIYIVHLPLAAALHSKFRDHPFLSIVVASLILAAAIYLFIDRPLNRYRERFAKRSQPQETDSVPPLRIDPIQVSAAARG